MGSVFWWLPISYGLYAFGFFVFNAAALQSDIAVVSAPVPIVWWVFVFVTILTITLEFVFARRFKGG